MRIPFGTHKGTEISMLPQSYLQWLTSDRTQADKDVKEEAVRVLAERAKGSSTVTSGSLPNRPSDSDMVSAPRSSTEYADVTKKDEYKSRHFDGEVRPDMKLGKYLAKVDGILFRYTEIRAIRPVKSEKPVMKGPYHLTHVVTFKDGCMGTGPKSIAQLWIVQTEADALEEILLGNSARSVAIHGESSDNDS